MCIKKGGKELFGSFASEVPPGTFTQRYTKIHKDTQRLNTGCKTAGSAQSEQNRTPFRTSTADDLAYHIPFIKPYKE